MFFVVVQKARTRMTPPFVHDGEFFHTFHVSFVIVAGVFIVSKDFVPAQRNGIVMQMAVVNNLDNFRPSVAMQLLVFFHFFGFEL